MNASLAFTASFRWLPSRTPRMLRLVASLLSLDQASFTSADCMIILDRSQYQNESRGRIEEDQKYNERRVEGKMKGEHREIRGRREEGQKENQK